MGLELAYVLINPYTIQKSRTGGVIARLLARSSFRIVAARMFSPSSALIKAYTDSVIAHQKDSSEKEISFLIKDYIEKNYSADNETGKKTRVMMLLFEGEDANKRLNDEVIGHIKYASVKGETIRDTYGDYIVGDGKVAYFEPAVLSASTWEQAQADLRIWSKFSDSDGGILEDVVPYPDASSVENTLVMIKPDNFRTPSIRVGNIIDMFSKTGLYIIGVRLVNMSIEQAQTFYGPVKAVLEEKMKTTVTMKITDIFKQNFEFTIPLGIKNRLVEEINPLYTEHEFNKIIDFITGVNPKRIKNIIEKKKKGTQTCLALVYQGINAVKKIRDVLGSTDPEKAAPATVRKEFGQNIMINTAHASDSVKNAKREIEILNVAGNDIKSVVASYFS
ncbi:nucleoside-diphosphate kinase [Chlamydiota bacterium]